MARETGKPGDVGRREFIAGAGVVVTGAVSTIVVGCPSFGEGVDARACRVLLHDPSRCTGCGTCAATCFSNSVDLDGFTDEQIYSEINSLMAVGQDLFPEPEKAEGDSPDEKAA